MTNKNMSLSKAEETPAIRSITFPNFTFRSLMLHSVSLSRTTICMSPARKALLIFFLSFLMLLSAGKSCLFSDSTQKVQILPVQETKYVLFISSYSLEFPTFMSQYEGLSEAFADYSISLDTEFMDSKRHGSSAAQEHFRQYLKTKLAESPRYDLVITADDNAFLFALEYGRELFPNIPLLFFGVGDEHIAEMQQKNPDISGIIEQVDISGTVEMIQTLIPKADAVIALSDGTITAEKYLSDFYEAAAEFPALDFSHFSLKNHSFNEMKSFLSSLDASAPVILFSAYKDKNGINLDFDESLHYINAYSNTPVFHLWPHGIGEGLVGGKVTSLKIEAAETGTRALEILSGQRDISSYPILYNTNQKYTADYEALKQWNIPVDLLDSFDEITVINKPVSLTEEYKTFFVPYIIAFSLLVVVIFLLSVHILYRRKTEKQLQASINHLNTLHAVDQIIARNIDFGKTLNDILRILQEQNLCDNALIYRYDHSSASLEVAAATPELSHLIGERITAGGSTVTGKVFQHAEPIAVTDISRENSLAFYFSEYSEHASYYGLPIHRDSEIFGVLELLYRVQPEMEEGWTNKMHTIRNQITAAVEKHNMINELYESNRKLENAYDSTLESFARILEFRDKETENHCFRVTELASSFAAFLGLSREDITAVRRGSLLHDVGKLIIPDSILHKPESLTKREWEIMKSHTTLAYESLHHIDFLKEASVIPYSHHEHWDGSGYPQGLKGNQIPLFARIFTIVDVWDALITNRPYRSAWAKEKTKTYMQENSGKIFDPKLLQSFLAFLEQHDDSIDMNQNGNVHYRDSEVSPET